VAARTIDEFIIRAYAPASSRPLGRSEAAVLNAAHYANATLRDERYAQARNTTPPRKIGRMLRLFDCLTCDKCVPVCPNAANFTFVVPPRAIPRIVLWHDATGWRVRRDGELVVAEPHQIGTFVDFCNDCGNCDVFCPEDGGPFRLKPRVFGTVERWRQAAPGDGFAFEQEDASERVFARLDGREYEVDVRGGRVNYRGDGFHVTFDGADPEGTVAGEASGQVELVWYEIMNELRRALLSGARVNWVNAAGKP
jgi:putative selenate reductase